MAELKTEILNEKLMKSENFDAFFETHGKHIRLDSFHNCLYDMISDSGLKNSDIFLAADLSESYGYQLLSGKRQPSRDKILKLAFALKLTLEKTNLLLKLGQKNSLYVKNKRDAILMFALNTKKSLIDTNALLESENCDLLL
ncbi:XRE family transcriptional regulator [Fusibacter tunisiensis]|uniref:XRE family transcriptional regulator n=1 Tax=Fusibacter tunisiensis TaxID=1008308 RepID=A0ABS2MN99_9FIRM|nr:XRE family transcriptional regulator [Fusibacter tunisiensis]MBM7560872.1 hypothetical protein [Fusibacter tunisiensis]